MKRGRDPGEGTKFCVSKEKPRGTEVRTRIKLGKE